MNPAKSNGTLKLLAALALAAAGFSGSAVAAPGTTINVNFGTDAGDAMNGKTFITSNYQQAPAYYPGTTWNDHIGPTIISGNPTPDSSFTNVAAVDTVGNVTGIGYTTASTTTPFDLEGPYTWGDHPNTKMLNGAVRRVYNSGSGNALNNRLTISGLDNAKVYNVYLASSQNPNVKCSWRIGAGGTDQLIRNTTATQSSETWRPGDNWTVFYGVAPVGGSIDVRGKGDAGGDAGAFSGLTLNGFQIVEATGYLIPDKAIYDFGTPGTTSTISNNNTGNNITWNVLFSANLAALSPTFTLADFATCSPVSGSTQNFSGGPVPYTVTAQDGSTRVYQVTALPAATPSTAANMLTFNLGANTGTINGTNVSLSVPAGTNVSAIAPTFTLSAGASASPVSGSIQNFSGGPVNYTVTAEDGVTTKVYTANVLQSSSWTSAVSSTWGIAGNWNPVAVPVSAFTTALAFNTAGTYTSTNDLGALFNLNQLNFSAGTVTLAGQSLLLGGAAPLVTQASSGNVVINNALDLGANTTFACSGSGQLTLGALVSGAGSLTKTGNATLNVNLVSSHVGGTAINAGTLSIGSTSLVNPLGSGTTTVNTGATLALNRTDFSTSPLTLNGGTLTAGNSFTSNLTGSVTLNALSTVNITGNLTFSDTSTVSGPGGIIKTGAADVPVLGTNTYTGQTIITGGSLRFKSSFYSNNTSLWIPANITVGNGASLVLNVGGSDFTVGQAGTLFANLATGVNNNGLQAGSLIGIDTSGAGGVTQVYSNTISDATGAGAGAVGIKHFGAGTLELTGPNTYTGRTIVDRSGTLRVTSINSVNGGSPPLASSSMGRPTTVANGTIILGQTTFQGGNLTYLGTGETTDRVVNLGGANGSVYTFDQSGSGLLKFTSDFTMTDLRGPQTVVLQGSTAGTGEMACVLPAGARDNPNSLTKSGTNTWTLSGANLFGGITTLNAGVLSVATISNGGLTPTLTTTAGSPVVTLASGSTAGMVPGQAVVSPRIPVGSTILTVDSPTQFTLVSGTGVTAGVGELSTIGTASNLGIAPSTASFLVLNNGTLRYTGATASTNRNFTIGNGTTATLEITANNLTISGASAATTGALTKIGGGTLTLGGDNLHTGPTMVNAGTLALVGGSQSSAITIGSTAFLGFTLGSATTSTKDVTLVAGARVRITGTPVSPTEYTLLTTSGTITGTPVLETPIPGYKLVASGGVLKLAVFGGYQAWAANYPSLTDLNSLRDFENDGLSTGIEYVVAGNPTMNDVPSVAPISAYTGTGLSFTYRRNDTAKNDPTATIVVQYGSDLTGWVIAQNGVNGVTIVENNDFYSPVNGVGVDQVIVTVPQSLAVGGKLFARLGVSGLPASLLDQNFEASNGGFTVVTTVGSSWQWGDPDSTGFGGSVTTGNGSSTNCWGTNIGNPGFFLDPTTTRLRSSVINLIGVASAKLSFAHAIDLDGADSAVVNIIAESTDTVISSAIYTAVDGNVTNADWAPANGGSPITIPPAALGQKVRLEWVMSGVGAGTDDYLGWYIDDVKVTTP